MKALTNTIPEYTYIVSVRHPHLKEVQHYEFSTLMSALQAIRLIKTGDHPETRRVTLKYTKKEVKLPEWAEELLTEIARSLREEP